MNTNELGIMLEIIINNSRLISIDETIESKSQDETIDLKTKYKI